MFPTTWKDEHTAQAVAWLLDNEQVSDIAAEPDATEGSCACSNRCVSSCFVADSDEKKKEEEKKATPAAAVSAGDSELSSAYRVLDVTNQVCCFLTTIVLIALLRFQPLDVTLDTSIKRPKVERVVGLPSSVIDLLNDSGSAELARACHATEDALAISYARQCLLTIIAQASNVAQPTKRKASISLEEKSAPQAMQESAALHSPDLFSLLASSGEVKSSLPLEAQQQAQQTVSADARSLGPFLRLLAFSQLKDGLSTVRIAVQAALRREFAAVQKLPGTSRTGSRCT